MPIGAVPVIDGGGHVMEPPDLWSSRMDGAKWGDWVPRVDPADGKRYVGGEVRNGGVDAVHQASALSGIPFAPIAENMKRVGASLMGRGGWDPATRLEDMDRADIDLDTLVAAMAPLGDSERARILYTNEVEAYGLPISIPVTV